MLFAYLVAVYLVGATLPRRQGGTVTGLYTAFAAAPVLAMYESVVAARDLHVLHRADAPCATSARDRLTAAPSLVPLMLTLARLASLLCLLGLRALRKD